MKIRIAGIGALSAALLVTLVCFAQDTTDRMMTGGIQNGRFWNAISQESKLAWLFGYRSGILQAALVSYQNSNPGADGAAGARETLKLQNQIIGISFPADLTYDEIAKSLDQFYDSPENLQVDLRDALEIVVLKTRGVAQSQIDEMISRFRKSAAEKGQP